MQVGYGEFQVTQERGQRADTFRQYLQPALDRTNLTVLTRARVSHVATDGMAGLGAVAVGVEFQLQDPDGPKYCGGVSTRAKDAEIPCLVSLLAFKCPVLLAASTDLRDRDLKLALGLYFCDRCLHRGEQGLALSPANASRYASIYALNMPMPYAGHEPIQLDPSILCALHLCT